MGKKAEKTGKAGKAGKAGKSPKKTGGKKKEEEIIIPPVEEPPKPPKVHMFLTDLNEPYLKERAQFIIQSTEPKNQPKLYDKNNVPKLGKPIEHILQDNLHPELIQYMVDINMLPLSALNFPRVDNRTPLLQRTDIEIIQVNRVSFDSIIGVAACMIGNHAFTMFVEEGSPAHIAGLRFGDEILEINDILIYKWTNKDLKKFLINFPADEFFMIIRKRPFLKTFVIKSAPMDVGGMVIHNGRILNVKKDSNADKAGILENSQIIEINSKNVVGMDDIRMRYAVEKGTTVTLTTMPGEIFDHFKKEMGKETLYRFYGKHLLPL